MRSHIDWRGERNIPYKGVETCPHTHFKTLRVSLEVKAQRGQYLLAVGCAVTNDIKVSHRTVCRGVGSQGGGL